MKRGAHIALGLGVVALVCAVVVLLVGTGGEQRTARPGEAVETSARGAAAVESVVPAAIEAEAGRSEARTEVPDSLDGYEDTPEAAEAASDLLVITVTDLAGTPIEGARVRLVHGEEVRELDPTDAEGTSRTAPTPEQQWVHVDAAGFASGHSSTDRPELRLTPVVTLAGRVSDAGTGVPVPGAQVRLVTGPCKRCDPREATAGGQGRFALEGVPLGGRSVLRGGYSPSRSKVLASAAGYATRLVEFELREEQSELSIELRPGRELVLEVVDAETRQPIEGARVRHGRAEEVTGADGRLRTTSLVSARVEEPTRLTASAADYLDLQFVVGPEPLENGEVLALPLLRSVSLEVELVDPAGLPVQAALHVFPEAQAAERLARDAGLPDGWLHAPPRHSFATSDAGGRARLSGLLPRSSSTVTVIAPSGEPTSANLEPAEPGAVVSQRIVVAAVQPPAAHGRLRMRVHSGERPILAFVGWSGPTASEGGFTDEDGVLVLEEVEVGEVELSIGAFPPHFDRSLREICTDELSWERTVEVRSGEETELDHDIGLPMIRLKGRVELVDGSPAAGRSVYGAAPGMCLPDQAVTDAEGRFELWTRADLAPQELVVRHGSSEHRAGGIDPTGEPPVVVLPELGELRWRALDAESGDALPELSALFRPAGADEYRWNRSNADPQGWHRIELAPGRYDLCLSGEDERGVYLPLFLDGILIAPETEPLTFELERGLELEVRLAEGLESWPLDEVSVLLLDDELLIAAGDDLDAFGPMASGRDQGELTPWFGRSRTDRLRGLRPGRHTFRAFPDTLVFEPAEVVVGPDTPPVELRWRYR